MLERIRYVTSGALLAALLTLGVYHLPVHAATLLPNGEQTFVDENGKPLASGCVYFYVPGTNTPKDTWVNPGGTATNTNPVILDAAGRAIIYGVGTYRQVVKKYPCGSLGEQVWDQLTADTASSTTIFAGASAGTPNAITVIAPAFTGEDGQVINYISTNTNTGGATINPSGFGNVQIVRDGSSGPGVLVGGELVATNAVSLIYDATAGVFHILSPVTWPNTSGVPVGTMIAHAGFTAPTNYAFAYGQAVSRTTYAALFSALTLAQTGSISSGSPTITGLADTTQIGYAMPVEAIGISPGTTILGCTSSTCTMSANASVTRSGTITFFAYGAGDGSLTFNLPDMRGRTARGRDNLGGTAANVTQTSTTISTTSASASATVASASGIAIGMTITSANVPAGATVTAISGTTITMSGNASATAVGTAVRFSLIPDAQALGSGAGSTIHVPVLAETAAHDHGGVTGSTTSTFSSSLYGTNTQPTVSTTTVSGGSYYNAAAGGPGVTNLPSINSAMNAHTHTITSAGGGNPFAILDPTRNVNYIVRLTP